MNARKGFVLSLVAVLFVMLLVLMAATMANEYAESQRVEAAPVPNSFASASLDNVGRLTADLLLPSASVAEDDSGATVSVSDALPRQVSQAQLSGLQYYAEGELADSQHANITVNTSQVENGSLDLRIMDNFALQSTINNSPAMVFRSMANGSSTNATGYNVTIYVDDYDSSITEFTNDPSGTVNATLSYSDRNGTVVDTVSLNPSAANYFFINYMSGGYADIVIGRVSQNGSNYNGALSISLTNETAAYSFSARLPAQPPSESSLIVFPVQMTYAQDGVQKTANASR